MPSPYEDDPAATNFRCVVGKLRGFTQSAVAFANAAAAAGGDPDAVFLAMLTDATEIYLEVSELEVTGIPSELIDYRQAWQDKAGEYWDFG